MAITALSGPLVVYKSGALSGEPANQNPDEAPSLFHQGVALLDPRSRYAYFPGQANSPVGFTSAGVAVNAAPSLGWLNAEFQVADYAPKTATTASLVSGADISTTTSVTLTATSNNAITTGSSCTHATTGATVSSLWLIDTVPASISFGQGAVGIWDPANPPIGRCLSITSTGDVSAINFTINGYDAYGYPITQTLAGGTTSTSVYTGKAFKWVSSISASTTSSTTFSVGVSDRYGLPFYASSLGYITAYWNDIAISASATATTFTAGTTLTTAGATDVRGTINLGGVTTSNSTRKLQMWMRVSPAKINTAAGLFGVTPA